MNCGSCGHENPQKAKFCMNCGNTLTPSCTNCGEELGDGAKFCMNCGTKVVAAGDPAPAPAPARDRLEQYIPAPLLRKLQAAQQGSTMTGERRVVTMLFCDVTGSTAAAEQLDPEEWADIMNGAFEHLIAPVYRYEGTLARLMGDAILAFFGAPIAHEDDPQRAILAGLAIVQEIEPYAREVRRKWGVEFSVRVGINTGLVVVGEVGTDMRLEYTAMGDAVNLAARMEATAEPGTVHISEETQKKVAPLFDLEPLGPTEIKGKAEPVETFRVLRPKSKPGRLRGIEGLDSPMVGREREAAVLRGRADSVFRGAGHIVGILGEAGLGKSRLAAELKKQLASEGRLDDLYWYEGRSLSYQTGTPYAAVNDVLDQIFEIPDESDADDQRRYAVLHEQVAAYAGEQASEITPYVASRLGLTIVGDSADRVRYLDPPDLRRQIDAAVVELLEWMAEKRPVVLMFEDLHWADSSTLGLLPELMKLTERAALLLVGILRPRPQDDSWKFHEIAARDFAHRYDAISLQPLDPDDSRRLVANLLHIEGLPESLRTLILMKSEGNPFFVEEVVRSLIDSGAIEQDGDHWRANRTIEDIAVPDSLAAVLTTRLDALSDSSKAVAQTAAVIGRQFEFDVLASIYEPLGAVEEALSDLQRRGIVREKSRRPARLYSFKHVLTQESAYESLLLRARRELHRKVAGVLNRIAPERSNDIARHFLEAREPHLALPHLVTAAEAAARAYSTPEALKHFGQALDIIRAAENPDLALARRVFEGRGTALQLVMDVPGSLANYQEMEAFFAARNDQFAIVSALNKTAFLTTMFLGDVDEGNKLLDQAQSLAQDIGCNPGQAESCMIRCAVYTAKAEFDMAYKYLDQATELGESMEAEEPLLYGRSHIANTMVLMTEFERAWPKIREALEAAQRFGNKKYQAEIMTFSMPTYQMNAGDGEAAASCLQDGIAIAEDIGAMAPLANGTALLGKMMEATGQFDRAIELHRKAVDAASRSGMPFLLSMSLCNLGTSYLQISEQLHPKALEVHAQALEVMDKPLGKAFAAMAFCELGFCAIDIGKPENAIGLFEQGLTTRSAPINICRPKLHMGIAVAAIHLGDLDRAAEACHAARQYATERGIHMYDPFLFSTDAHLAAAQGRVDDALDQHGTVADIAENAGLRPLLWKTHAAMGGLHRRAGRVADADAAMAKAESTIDDIVNGLEDPGLRELYSNYARKSLG